MPNSIPHIAVFRRRPATVIFALLTLTACIEPVAQVPPFPLPPAQEQDIRAPDVMTIPDGTPYVAYGYSAFGPRTETRIYASDVAALESAEPRIAFGTNRLPAQGYWRVPTGTYDQLVATIAAESDTGLLEDDDAPDCDGAIHTTFAFAFAAPGGQANVGILADAGSDGTIYGVTTRCLDYDEHAPWPAEVAFQRIEVLANDLLSGLFE